MVTDTLTGWLGLEPIMADDGHFDGDGHGDVRCNQTFRVYLNRPSKASAPALTVCTLGVAGADPGFGQGGPQQIFSDICRRRAAPECERSEHIGVQGPP